MPILPPLVGFGIIFDLRGFQTATLWTNFFEKKVAATQKQSIWECSLRRPCFSLDQRNYCAVGTHCFLNVISGMGFSSFSIFPSSVFLCPICCITFLSLFVYYTTLKAEPSNPPFFEKIAPHFNKRLFSDFVPCVYIFSFS